MWSMSRDIGCSCLHDSQGRHQGGHADLIVQSYFLHHCLFRFHLEIWRTINSMTFLMNCFKIKMNYIFCKYETINNCVRVRVRTLFLRPCACACVVCALFVRCLCARACVRVCLCLWVRACVRACVRVFLRACVLCVCRAGDTHRRLFRLTLVLISSLTSFF